MNNFVFLFVIALCGTRVSSLNVERTNRIAGGSPATYSEFLYVISLQEKSQLTTYTRGHRCGGAMVTTRHAVTSASCVHDFRNDQFVVINATEYRVFAGSFNLSDNSADRRRDIEKITVHPDYRPNTPYVNDIAVITLVSDFPNSVVGTIPLAESEPDTAQGQICQGAGWGSQNGSSSASTHMMHRNKTVYDQAPCQAVYSMPIPGFTPITLRESMMCAINTLSPSCQGDLGNPLVCNWHLTGILVYHRNDCSVEVTQLPEIYTRISSFRSWIERTSGASTFQPGMAVLGLICIVQIVTAKVLQ